MIAKVLVAVLATLAVVNAASFKEEEYQLMFSKFMGQYNKKYSADTIFYRYSVFKNNMDKIHLSNKQNKTYTLGMNEMGDMTHAEYKATKLGYNGRNNKFLRAQNSCSFPAPPAAIDWSSKGAVTPIKNQGQCGSCWSFSTTGCVEGATQIASGHLVSLSEQQLIDCSTAQGNQGCNGGLMDDAFEYIISNGGLTTEADYPYSATGPNTCSVTTPLAATITGYCDVDSGNEASLAAAVGAGPVSVAIEADQNCFQFYSGGVLNDPTCGNNLDHGVLVVGFGHDATSGLDYWKVKNSWGASWGLAGYINIWKGDSAQQGGECGIASEPSTVSGAKYLGPGKKAAIGRAHRKH
jgi:cathepsin L